MERKYYTSISYDRGFKVVTTNYRQIFKHMMDILALYFPKELEDNILKLNHYILDYQNPQTRIYAKSTILACLKSLIGFSFIQYSYIGEELEFSPIKEENEKLEELLNTYISLKKAIYRKIIQNAIDISEGKEINSDDITVIDLFKQFNLSTLFENLTNDIHSVDVDLAFMRLFSKYLDGKTIDKDDLTILLNSKIVRQEKNRLLEIISKNNEIKLS